MLVSGFTLAYAPGSTHNPAYASGYELEITNLSDNEIQFDVLARVTRYWFTLGPPPAPSVILRNLKELIPGVLRNDRQTWFEGDWYRDVQGYTLRIAIPIAPRCSELFDIVPSLFQPEGRWPRVAGHIELIIPAVLSTEPPYEWGPQVPGPVPVVLNPSAVEKWEVLRTGGSEAFSYTRTSPPLASGRAFNEIEPDTDPRLTPISDG